MKEATIITWFDELRNEVRNIAYNQQLGFSGEALFDETLKSLLFKKGIITETEWTEALSDKIREINAKENDVAKAEADAAKPKTEELVTPTPAEVAKVEETKVE